jgi:hypothetical protein
VAAVRGEFRSSCFRTKTTRRQPAAATCSPLISGDRIHRARFKTVGSSHPAGTSVIAVNVTFVEDWSCADSADQEP